MATEERVVAMANQIARNIVVQGGADPAEATAAHIRAFWDRRMKGLLTAHFEGGGNDLSLVAREAAAILARERAAAGAAAASG
jgi:formate dehydrogenase subunit delta